MSLLSGSGRFIDCSLSWEKEKNENVKWEERRGQGGGLANGREPIGWIHPLISGLNEACKSRASICWHYCLQKKKKKKKMKIRKTKSKKKCWSKNSGRCSFVCGSFRSVGRVTLHGIVTHNGLYCRLNYYWNAIITLISLLINLCSLRWCDFASTATEALINVPSWRWDWIQNGSRAWVVLNTANL